LIEDIPATILGTASTRALLIAVQCVSVIVAQFFTLLNISASENPDLAIKEVRFTVRRTGMIDIPCSVLLNIAVNIGASIEEKDIDIPLGDTPGCFLWGNLLSEIRQNARAFGNILRGEYACPVYAGFANAEPNLHDCPLFTLHVWLWDSATVLGEESIPLSLLGKEREIVTPLMR
jgi:hypothetical protein